MHLSDSGRVVWHCWNALPARFPFCAVDAFVVMPNHVHGIVVLNQGQKGAASSAPTDARSGLGKIIRAFKSLSAIEVNRALRRRGAPVWQRNYFEHVVRAGEDLDEIRRYINDNPARWDFDRENPASMNSHELGSRG